jgi:hypothetical protein
LKSFGTGKNLGITNLDCFDQEQKKEEVMSATTFIKFTDRTGDRVYINPAFVEIINVMESTDRVSLVYRGHQVFLNEPTGQVLSALEIAGCKVVDGTEEIEDCDL